MNFDLTDNLKTGIKEAKCGNTRIAMEALQPFAHMKHFPEAKAWFGYCLAHEKKDASKGIEYCKGVLKRKSKLVDGYLALAKIYLDTGQNKQAFDVLQQGLKETNHVEVYTLLKSMGIRKKPVLPFLSRSNILNIRLGRIMASMGVR